jgi:hypothetical protein
MMYFISHNSSGLVTRFFAYSGPAEEYTPLDDEVEVEEIPQEAREGRAFFVGGRFITLPEQPSPAHIVDEKTRTWVLDPTLAAAQARKQRDYLIAKSDWTQLPDIDQAVKDKWQAYRQALRDITSQPGFPENIQWPEPPK